MTPGTYDAVGERAQVMLVWVRAPGVGNATETRSHEGEAINYA